MFNNIAAAPLGTGEDQDFRISIASAQEKTALLRKEEKWFKPAGTTAITHILKLQIGQLPNGIDLSNSVENEYLCLKLLAALGVPTAHTEIVGERHTLIIERFDRRWTELFQRTLDWASHYDLPISTADRSFTLRTYHNTRIANFHALTVKRVADRTEAELVLRKSDRRSSWYRPGGSRTTTPRMIAAHHSLAVAFGRMPDGPRLTGQIDFRAEFDLTNQRRNAYPALPDLSDISRRLRRLLPKVERWLWQRL